MSKRTGPYRVEVERGGCKHCGHDKQWGVVVAEDGEDVMVGGQTFGDHEEAEWFAGNLNEAFRQGTRAR